MKDTEGKGLNTRAIHAGQPADPATGAVMTPIYATSTYAQESPGEFKVSDYSRGMNPTRRAFEDLMADLEGGVQGFGFASGMAATSTILELLDSGDHVIASEDLYGGTGRLFERVRSRSAGLEFTLLDLRDLDAVRAAIRPETRMIWLETPSNPLLRMLDLEAIAAIAREHELLTVSDNTFATPYNTQPLNYGFDLVMHSVTKYLNGHSGHHRWRGGGAGAGAGRAPELPAHVHRRDPRAVRCLPRHARREDPGDPHGAPR